VKKISEEQDREIAKPKETPFSPEQPWLGKMLQKGKERGCGPKELPEKDVAQSLNKREKRRIKNGLLPTEG